MSSKLQRKIAASPDMLEDVKRHLNMDGVDCEDEILETDIIPAAIDWIEAETRRTLAFYDVVETFDRVCPRLELTAEPVCEISKVEIYSRDDCCSEFEWEWVALKGWDLIHEGDGSATFIKVGCCGCCCKACCCDPPDRIRVHYKAGHTTDTLPPRYKQAIRWTAANFYMHRETLTEQKINDMPMALTRTLQRMRRHYVGVY